MTSQRFASTLTAIASSTSSSAFSMQQEDRKLIRRFVVDILILVVLIIPILMCEFVLEPFRRGFFCDDDTIRYPFQKNTVTPLMLGLLVGLVPAFISIFIEYWRLRRPSGKLEKNFVYIFRCKVPTWFSEFFCQMVYFIFGLLFTLDATEMVKYTIGRLRPHFLAVCQPQLPDGTTCFDAHNRYRYIEDYVCQIPKDFTTTDLIQARLSFPSGHSSLAFYAMLYVVFYIQYRWIVRSATLARFFVQFICMMLAWFTALSRIMDNWHHWTDVFFGSMIGIAGAVFTAKFIAEFQRKGKKFEHRSIGIDSMQRQDTTSTIEDIISSANPPPYLLNGTTTAVENRYGSNEYCSKV